MSDAIPLPARPNLEQYKKRAKDLQRRYNSGDPEAIGQVTRHSRGNAPSRCTLATAQFSLARAHGFASWPKFARHLQALAREQSPVSQFEAAADAIVSGDSPALERLLRDNPALVRERSTREHRSALLHYVSANGVEDFRQKTPPNIVEIARMLLDAGADVNAESDAYRGRSTTLGLTATSWHPEKAGVQIPLMELLIARGATIDGPDGSSAVNACLHNGRSRAAEYLAERGARLDLEGACGVGRLDLVKELFQGATSQQIVYGLAWACEFAQIDVVEFLVDAGVDPNARTEHGEAGLHWAALGGHPDVVRALLDRGAIVDLVDSVHHGTPLGWAMYAWANAVPDERTTRYCTVVEFLVRAGARVNPIWLDQARSDERMLAALGFVN